MSLESAQGFRDALSEFNTELVETAGGRYHVEVTLGGSDRTILAALKALETYVSERGDGPAKVAIDGHKYTLHPEPD